MTTHNKPDSEIVSDTPRTEEFLNGPNADNADEVVDADFARSLERELNERTCEMIVHNGQAFACSEPVMRAFHELEKKLATARNDALEEALEIVSGVYREHKEREAAHYRHSSTRFNPHDFGVNMAVINFSQEMSLRIRDLKSNNPGSGG